MNKGLLGEYMAMKDASEKNYIIARTDESNSDFEYDILIDDGKKIYRVEVKTSDFCRRSRTTGKPFKDRVQFNLYKRNTKGNTRYDYIDYFALYWPKQDKIAWITKDQIGEGGKITIKYSEFELYKLPKNDNFNYIEEES